MALDFPSSPTNGQTYGNYYYDASVGAWNSFSSTTNTIPSTLKNLSVTTDASGLVPFTINGVSGQTANLQEWKNSAGSNVASMTNAGILTVQTLNLTNDLTVENGGTGAGTFTTGAYLKGNGTSAIQAQTGIPFADVTMQQIGAAANLDTFVTQGLYHQSSNANAAGGTNYPVALAGLLEVFQSGTDGSGFTYQRYTVYQVSHALYERAKFNTTWSAWQQVPLGTVSVAQGGTGATTLTSGGYLKGAGTGAITSQTGIPAGDITSGSLVLARGGTNASLTATAGGVLYSTASAMAISAAGTSGLALVSGGTGAPTWGYPTSFCVRLTSTIAQSTSGTAGAASYYQWSADSFSSGMWSSGANTRITPNRAGKWRVSAKIRYVATSGAAGYVQVQMNRASNSPSEGLQTDSIGGAYPWAQDIFNVTNVGTDYFETAFFSTGITHGTTQANAIMLAEYIGP